AIVCCHCRRFAGRRTHSLATILRVTAVVLARKRLVSKHQQLLATAGLHIVRKKLTFPEPTGISFDDHTREATIKWKHDYQ
ncbi:hypothetical protein ANCCAN_08778, partial [Ancylostoma caninum]